MLKLLTQKRNKKGFTLAELLIVIAIIAILIAIAIPAFASALEKANEAVDNANIRSAYAEYMITSLTGGTYTGVADSDDVDDALTALGITGWKAASTVGVNVNPTSGAWTRATSGTPTFSF